MNRHDVLARLLQHGPLTSAETIVITGWPVQRVHAVIERMRKSGELRRQNIAGKSAWSLTDDARVPLLPAESAETPMRALRGMREGERS
jgi:DNA-binding transcriptional regulator PaaX